MKKLLAILLTLILTFSCFSLLGTGTALAEEKQQEGDIIMTSDFEDSTTTKWQSCKGGLTSITYNSETAADGSTDYYARVNSTSSGFLSAPFELVPGNEYELTFDIRIPEESKSYLISGTTFYAPNFVLYETTASATTGKVTSTPKHPESSDTNLYATDTRRSDFKSEWKIGDYDVINRTGDSTLLYGNQKNLLGSTTDVKVAYANWTTVTVKFTAVADEDGETSQTTALAFNYIDLSSVADYLLDVKDVQLKCTVGNYGSKTIMQSDFNDPDGTNWQATKTDAPLVTYGDDNSDGVNDYARVKIHPTSKNQGLVSSPFNLIPGNEYELTYYIRVPKETADGETASFLIGSTFYAPTVAFYQPTVNSTGTKVTSTPSVSTEEASNNYYAYKGSDWSRREGFAATWTIDGYEPTVKSNFSNFGYSDHSSVLSATNETINDAFADWTKVTVNFTAMEAVEGETSQVTALSFTFHDYKSADNFVFDIKDVTLMETAAIEEEKPEEIDIPELPDYPALPDVEAPTGNTYTTTVTGENCDAFVSEETAIEGSKVIVSAVPYAGYKFAGWYENDVLVSPEKQFVFTVSENRTLVAKSVAVTEENTEIAIYPDVSYDGIVDLTDITNIAKNLAGWDVENINTSRIDVNGDGEVNLKDLVLSAQYVAGWDVKNKLASKDAYLLPEEDLEAEGLSDTVKAGESEYFNKSTIINEGNRALFVNLFEKASRGEAITVVSIGGSITQGVKDAEGNDRSFGKLVSEWIAEKFGVEVTNINAGIGSTNSLYGIHRLESDVLSHNPDLVILEYSVNDISSKQSNFPYLETYEAIIRRVLEKDIALLTAVFGGSGTTFYKDYLSLHIHSALHYDLPVIDYYSALFRYLESGVISWYDENDNEAGITKDKLHPNTTGHVMIASAMCYYLDDVYNKYQAGEVYETAIDIPKETLFKNADVYETATFLASTNDLGYETITPYFNYENRFTAAKVHGDSSKMGKGWVCENQQGVIVFDLQDVTSISLSMMQKKDVTGTYSITINGKTIVDNQTSSTANNVIWPTYCRVFNEPTDLVVTITCHEGTVGVGPIGVTY